MSTAASQLILHPVLSQSLKVLSTTLGRDKVYRGIQNFARFYAWYLLSRGLAADAASWNALKSHLGLARKLLRLGKPLEHLQAALRATQTAGEAGEQITTVARQLCYFGYLTYDAFVWANAVKFYVLKPATAVKVNKNANRYWLFGIIFSIIHSLVKFGRLANEAKKLKSPAWNEKDVGLAAGRDQKLQALEVTRAATRQQFVIDVLDIWIPASGLGLVNINDGLLGIFGIITSVLALQKPWENARK